MLAEQICSILIDVKSSYEIEVQIANRVPYAYNWTMTFTRAAAILALTAGALFALSCSGSSGDQANSEKVAAANRSNANANAAGTNVEELGVIVNVPYESEDVVWKQSPDRKKVLAVLRFSPADSDRIVAEAVAFGAPAAVTIAAESWFPDELIAQSDVSGDSSLKGLSYPANRFYLDPFSNGRITRVDETDYFILELTAK